MTYKNTRDHLLHIAEEVFSEVGYEQASVRYIVARANVNQAAVNYHFGSKEELYRAVLEDAVGEHASEHLFDLIDPTLDPIEKIRWVANHRIRSGIGTTRQDLPPVLGWEIISPRFGLPDVLEAAFANSEQQIMQLLTPLFAVEMSVADKELATRWFFTATLPPLMLSQKLRSQLGDTPSAEEIERLVDQLVYATMAGLQGLCASGGQRQSTSSRFSAM